MEPAPPRCIRLRSGVGEAKSGTVSPRPIIPGPTAWSNARVARSIYRWHFDSTAMLDAALYGFERYSTSIGPTKPWAAKRPPS